MRQAMTPITAAQTNCQKPSTTSFQRRGSQVEKLSTMMLPRLSVVKPSAASTPRPEPMEISSKSPRMGWLVSQRTPPETTVRKEMASSTNPPASAMNTAAPARTPPGGAISPSWLKPRPGRIAPPARAPLPKARHH